MPKVGLMAQISRPFQIAFVAMALFAVVWLLALRGHSSSTSGSGSPAATPSSSPAAPSSAYHGSAPGVEGLTRAIAKAHGAVTTSQQNAQQLQERSAQASGEKPSASAGGTTAPKASPTAPAAAPVPATASPTAKHAPAKTTTHARSAVPKTAPSKVPAAAGTAAQPSMQLKVEAELKQGKIVTILFWNPTATDDQAVSHQLQSVGSKLHASVAVHKALASQVGLFGTIIRGVKVYGTPTVMIINQRGQAMTLTGYTDAYAIEQAIGEARHLGHR
jgi:hypothetical protein